MLSLLGDDYINHSEQSQRLMNSVEENEWKWRKGDRAKRKKQRGKKRREEGAKKEKLE